MRELLKGQVLDRLWELEIRMLEGCPLVREKVREAADWLLLAMDRDRERAAPIRDQVIEAGRLLETGRKSLAMMNVRQAIREVNHWS